MVLLLIYQHEHIGRFSKDIENIENEWTQTKYIRVEKILVLALLFSKL